MNNKLAMIKHAVIYGGYVNKNDYWALIQTAKSGVKDDASDAQCILRSYNERSNNHYYDRIQDPFRDVDCRDKGAEKTYGDISTRMF